MSSAAAIINGFNGKCISRVAVQDVARLAKDQEQTTIAARLEKMLDDNPDEKTFKIKITAPAIEVVPQSFLRCLECENDTDGNIVGLGKPVSPNEIYDMMTKRMIQLVKEANAKDYVKKWSAKAQQYGTGYLIPYNFVSKKPYRGINRFLLAGFVPMANPFYLTFHQVEDLGGKVKQGSHGHEVIYFTLLYRYEQAEPKLEFSTYDKQKFIGWLNANHGKIGPLQAGLSPEMLAAQSYLPILKYYKVFNGADIEGIDFDLQNFKTGYIEKEAPAVEESRMPVAEAIAKYYPQKQPSVAHGGQRAYYTPATDHVQMPKFTDFDTAQDYYRTFFHELGHSTGHGTRLARPLSMEKKAYAFEELIAEFTATFLSAEAGILWHTNKNHAAYLKNWNAALTFLEEDNRFLMRAATQAQAAADYVLSLDSDGMPAYMKDIKASLEPKKKANPVITDKFSKKYGIDIAEIIELTNNNPKLDAYQAYEQLFDEKNDKYPEVERNDFDTDLFRAVAANRDYIIKSGYLPDIDLTVEVNPVPVARKPYNRKGVESLRSIVSKDKIRKHAVHGYLVEADKIVATDLHKIVILKGKQTKNVGKVVFFDGRTEPAQSYPDYKRATPNYTVQSKAHGVQQLINYLNGAADFYKRIKYSGVKIIALFNNDVAMPVNPELLYDVLLVLQGNGTKNVFFSFSELNRPVRINADNGNYGVVMPYSGLKKGWIRIKGLNVLPDEASEAKGLSGPATHLFDFTVENKPALNAPAPALDQDDYDTEQEAEEITVHEPEEVAVVPVKVLHPVNPVKANPLVQSSKDLMNMHFESLDFTGEWADFMQSPAKNMKIAIWGKPKNGKTSGAAKFAEYLTQYGNVLYNFVDQGLNKSTQDIWRTSGLANNDRAFAASAATLNDLETLVATGDYQFVFIDMINTYIDQENVKPHEFKQRFIQKYPDISFILVMEVTKSGNFKGDQGWTHIVDALVTVEDFLMEARGRYGTGHYIVWEEGFKRFNPKKYDEICEAGQEEITPQPAPMASNPAAGVLNFL